MESSEGEVTPNSSLKTMHDYLSDCVLLFIQMNTNMCVYRLIKCH